jgi:hypothetical protein
MKEPLFNMILTKLKLMYNTIIDKTGIPNEKFDIYTDEEVSFSICTPDFTDDSGIKE